jgi:hypothetical protein
MVTKILKQPLAHPLAMALSQSYVQTFDDFRTIDVDDVHKFKYTISTVLNAPADTKLHFQLVKQIQRGVCYARYKEGLNDTESDDPTLWNHDIYFKWCRNGYATYLETINAVATPLPASGTTTAFVNSFPAMAVILRPLFGVIFFGEHISLKN